jgi:hypothetical protein
MADILLIGLTRLNVVLATATVLVAFSLLVYLFVYNFRDPVARAFVGVLAFASVVYVGDVFLATARLDAGDPAAAFWLRFEWLGIAFIAPAYLHFGDALLATTGAASRMRRWVVLVATACAALVLVAVLGGDRVVDGVVGTPGMVRLAPGPWYPLFALGYVAVTARGAHDVWHARSRALTARSRRRMSYLLVSVIAPLSVFPYLVGGAGLLTRHPLRFVGVSAVAYAATAAMTVVMAYAVAYHGALTPDRQVKRELLKYLIQGPLLGVFVVATLQLVPARLQSSLGLPRDVVFALVVVVGIVLYQLTVRALRPLVDVVIYGTQSREVLWLRRLDERLFTAEDLEQLLENILAAMCDRLRVRTGYVLVLNNGRLQVDVHTGPAARAIALLDALGAEHPDGLGVSRGPVHVAGFRVWALHPPDGGATLGFLAVEDGGGVLLTEEEAALDALVVSAERALEDRVVQQRVIGALRDLEPELAGIQRLRGALEHGDVALTTLEATLIHDPDFPHWVKDALSHYWGGPKLTESPLLGLQVVREALRANDFNTARAMRSVLDQALDRLKPAGERSSTANQWLIYNILELKFVRGLKVRDIAQRLAMSESDLYRKQRVAVAALSRQLAVMEAEPATARGADADASTASDGP